MRLAAFLLAAALAQRSPVPLPGQPPAPSEPTQPAAPPAAPTPTVPGSEPSQQPSAAADSDTAVTEATLGVPIYPGAQFLRSFDAGQGQRIYIFGSTASFVSLVTYYRTILKQRGELVFEAPATHQFDVGRFREQTMAFPPSVTIKDYESASSPGYPNPTPGAKPERFPTIIQVVPPPPGESR